MDEAMSVEGDHRLAHLASKNELLVLLHEAARVAKVTARRCVRLAHHVLDVLGLEGQDRAAGAPLGGGGACGGADPEAGRALLLAPGLELEDVARRGGGRE